MAAAASSSESEEGGRPEKEPAYRGIAREPHEVEVAATPKELRGDVLRVAAEAAALEYYGCHAADLNRSQSIAIAVCLPNPIRFNPRVKSSYLSERQAQIRSLIPKLEYPDWVR